MLQKRRLSATGWTEIFCLRRKYRDNAHEELMEQKGIYADFVLGRREAIGWKLEV